jgi:hypothetical protein
MKPIEETIISESKPKDSTYNSNNANEVGSVKTERSHMSDLPKKVKEKSMVSRPQEEDTFAENDMHRVYISNVQSLFKRPTNAFAKEDVNLAEKNLTAVKKFVSN